MKARYLAIPLRRIPPESTGTIFLACDELRCETKEMPTDAYPPPVQMEAHTITLSRVRTPSRFGGTFWLLFGFSIFYFTDVCIRASEKFFWYDEFFTLHLSQIPGLGPLWAALRQGADFNPPFFYLLTKASRAFFGNGLVGTRMPEIFGFWLLCICLFVFVNRRAGAVAGSIAMLLPIVTGAFFYAYEARPYGLVVGFCGLAIVCWQRACWRKSSDVRNRGWWLAGLGLSLLSAFMTNCYALVILAPFALTEIWRTIQSGRTDKPMWTALLIPAILPVALYIPLLSSYGALTKGTTFETVFVANWEQISRYYVFLLKPCLEVFLLAAVLLLVDRWRISRSAPARSHGAAGYKAPEIVLSACFVALPVFGLMLAKVVHGPFFARYFLSGVAGIGLLVGLAFGTRPRENWPAATFLAVMVLAVCLQTSRLAWHRYHGWGEPLFEPSTGITLDTTPGEPLDVHPLLASPSLPNLPIAVPVTLDYLYLKHYAPGIAPRLYLICNSKHEFSYRGLRLEQNWMPVLRDNHILTHGEFLHSFPHAFVYVDNLGLASFAGFVQRGAAIESLHRSGRHFLAEIVARPERASGSTVPQQ